jgi:homocysteine S-methyltransferase
VADIHRAYADAGAHIVTANTFRTHARNLKSVGLDEQAATLTHEAVCLARMGADGRAYVAGSQAPLADCYSPDQTPDRILLLDEHRRHAENLASAGVDLILVETMVTAREAAAAARAASESGLPVFVSFVCRPDGHLLSGETLSEALDVVGRHAPAALLVNCVSADNVDGLLDALTSFAGEALLGVYANTARLNRDGSWEATEAHNPAVYAELAAHWHDHGMQVIGGCCGTTPEHISAVSERLCVKPVLTS